MTESAAPAPATPPGDPIIVHADADGGRPVAEFVLGHGADPVRELARLGWSRPRLRGAERVADGSLVLTYAVAPASAVTSVANPVPTDPGLVLEPGEEARPYQRTAAYGVVTSDRGVLLTELSALTSAPGRWTLPGGGLDPGEAPVAALHREVWEESGQEVEAVRLLEAHTSHWIGRAPSGRLEDFHAVRIVYAASCPQPTDPVVHDVGGSTEAVRWVRRDELDHYHLSRSFAPHMRRWLAS
ncbi:NUDIX hydrolase [Pedococcus bigeumensis]|uniref:NUDIX hydrolase n=1 Tax=Pedococcus bigeumensis TaxID=433644 RepID=UPI001F4F8D13|nr:NUDIX domain-containing protein [Pedococcus bigeumensis]